MRFLDPFFSEWAHKRPGQTRSLDRAAALMRALDLDPAALPVLGVVGSKGKGSTATYAAAALGAAGLRTVLATGPSFRSYRERVRVDGASVTDEEMDALGQRIDEARRRLPSVEESGGHLAPSGLFLVAAMLRAHEVGADVCVLEAGAGGHRDELRLIGPDVVAMSTVFGEHLGVLGDTVPEIAREKARVAGARTRALVTLPQTGEVTEAVAEALAGATDGRVAAETVDPAAPGTEPPPALRPSGLSAASGVLGTAAALRMLDVLDRPRPERARLHEVLGTVRLPARLSRHAVPGAEAAEVVVDSAINGTGVAAALAHARDLWGGVDHVLLCLPDHKDVTGVVESLGGLPVTAVVLPEDHLRFDRALPDHWRTAAAEDLSPALLAGLGRRILALGTVYFTGRVLEAVQAPTDRLFDTGRG
jgi:dihydrofolate synthase/folylpolyglutamate synthase